MATKLEKLIAGHAEIQGETIAKFELFDQGFNPYSRYLDIDKVDLILRKRTGDRVQYCEVQVKFGRLYPVGRRWEKELFDVTSWKFFRTTEFKNCPKHLFIAYVLGNIWTAGDSRPYESLLRHRDVINGVVSHKFLVYRSLQYNSE